MIKIASFTVNHTQLNRGLYVSRRDGELTTFDLRMRRPYADMPLSAVEMHSLEHLLATALRNGALQEHIVYAGPMGCATGFYVLYRGVSDGAAVLDLIRAFQAVLSARKMPGNSRAECGNCLTLDLAAGKRIAEEYLKLIVLKTIPDKYPSDDTKNKA